MENNQPVTKNLTIPYGETPEKAYARLHAESHRPINVREDWKQPNVRNGDPKAKEGQYICFMCGKGYSTQRGYFPSGGKSILWKGNHGYLPFCKSCVDILMNSLTDLYCGNQEHALRHLCAIFDWCYDEDISLTTTKSKSRACSYPAGLATKTTGKRLGTFAETVINEFIERRDSQAIPAAASVNSDSAEEDEYVVTPKHIRTWGGGFTPDQYRFLEEELSDWLAKNVCKTKAQEELFRNIALAQLDVRIARQKGGDVPKAQRALQELMNSANILPKQNSDNILAETQTFGTLLKKFEETSPIPEPAEEWKDVDGIRRYMNTWFRGGLAKALKINNENTKLYDEAVEEMERYTVAPASASSDENENDASIFDQGEDAEGGG